MQIPLETILLHISKWSILGIARKHHIQVGLHVLKADLMSHFNSHSCKSCNLYFSVFLVVDSKLTRDKNHKYCSWHPDETTVNTIHPALSLQPVILRKHCGQTWANFWHVEWVCYITYFHNTISTSITSWNKFKTIFGLPQEWKIRLQIICEVWSCTSMKTCKFGYDLFSMGNLLQPIPQQPCHILAWICSLSYTIYWALEFHSIYLFFGWHLWKLGWPCQ